MTGHADDDFAVPTTLAGPVYSPDDVVADDRDREDEADLIVPAAAVTSDQMAFLLRWGGGVVCTPMTEQRAGDLRLPHMVHDNTDAHGTAFTGDGRLLEGPSSYRWPVRNTQPSSAISVTRR